MMTPFFPTILVCLLPLYRSANLRCVGQIRPFSGPPKKCIILCHFHPVNPISDSIELHILLAAPGESDWGLREILRDKRSISNSSRIIVVSIPSSFIQCHEARQVYRVYIDRLTTHLCYINVEVVYICQSMSNWIPFDLLYVQWKVRNIDAIPIKPGLR